MKQVKCVITDDEPTACEGLQRYVEKVDFLSLMGVCEDTMQLNTLLQTEQPDLLFLDIEMPEFTGIDVSKMIRDNLKNDATQIAYISGNKEYAIEIFEYDPLYFVHKPINKEKIEKVFERLIHRLHLQADAFTYKTGHNIVKIPIKDIIYFESEDHQIIIHYYTQNEYHKDSFYGLLDHVQKQLKSFQFLRIHKTYLVHHLYVRKYAYDKVYLSTGIELPIAQSKRKEIRAEQFAINRKESV